MRASAARIREAPQRHRSPRTPCPARPPEDSRSAEASTTTRVRRAARRRRETKSSREQPSCSTVKGAGCGTGRRKKRHPELTAGRCPPASERDNVNRRVYCDKQRAKHGLRILRKSFWIQKRYDIVIDEAAAVSRLSGPLAQSHFQRRQWADCSAEFNKRGPDDCRKVQPGEPGPAQ